MGRTTEEKDIIQFLNELRREMADKGLTQEAVDDILKETSIILGDNSIDITELHTIFTDKVFNAAELKNSGWQRKK